jgi:hypothetical protein
MKKILASIAMACFAVGAANAAITGVTWSYNNTTRTHVFTRGVPITPDTATTTGTMRNNVNDCAAIPALPAGLTLTQLTTTTCVLAGTPTVTSPTTTYHVHFRASSGADSVTHLTITVGPVTNLMYPKIVTGTVGKLMVNVAPALGMSSGTITYSADSLLPAGITLSSSTGVIAGTPSAPFPGRTYVIKASNGTDSTTAMVRIEAKAAVNYSVWSGHRMITVNPAGLNLGAPVTNFPVLVRLGGGNADIFAASATGADVRFTAMDSVTALPFQIERWDASAKRAEIWVTLPSVSNSVATTFLLHYGVSGQTTASSGPETFSTQNGYQAVWHMTGAPASPEPDATANAINADPSGSLTTNTNSAVGLGRVFDGGSYLTATGSAGGPLNFNQNAGWTISAWVTMDAATYQRTVVSKSNFQYALQTSYQGSTGPRWETVEYMVGPGRSGWPHAFSPSDSMRGGEWFHVVGVSSGGALYSYVNGNLAGSAPPGNEWDNSTTARNTGTPVSIGGMFENESAGLTRGWVGDIDEVQMSSVPRDSNWVRLSYATQKPGSAAVTVAGTVGILPGTPGVKAAFSARTVDGSFRFAIPAGSNGGRLAVLDLNGRPVWSASVNADVREVSWNGRSAAGSALARGMYFARFTAADGRAWETRIANTR